MLSLIVRLTPPVQTTKKAPIKVVDLSEGCASPVVVRGMVIGSDDKEPLIGASVVIDGTNKGRCYKRRWTVCFEVTTRHFVGYFIYRL